MKRRKSYFSIFKTSNGRIYAQITLKFVRLFMIFLKIRGIKISWGDTILHASFLNIQSSKQLMLAF